MLPHHPDMLRRDDTWFAVLGKPHRIRGKGLSGVKAVPPRPPRRLAGARQDAVQFEIRPGWRRPADVDVLIVIAPHGLRTWLLQQAGPSLVSIWESHLPHPSSFHCQFCPVSPRRNSVLGGVVCRGLGQSFCLCMGCNMSRNLEARWSGRWIGGVEATRAGNLVSSRALQSTSMADLNGGA